MPAASLMRPASQSLSIKSARSRAQAAAARGLSPDGGGRSARPRRAIRAGLGQAVRPPVGLLAGVRA